MKFTAISYKESNNALILLIKIANCYAFSSEICANFILGWLNHYEYQDLLVRNILILDPRIAADVRLSLPLFIRQVFRPQDECARFLSQCVTWKFEMEDNQKILLLVGMNERARDVACAGPLLLPVCRRQAIVLRGGAKHLFDAAEQRS